MVKEAREKRMENKNLKEDLEKSIEKLEKRKKEIEEKIRELAGATNLNGLYSERDEIEEKILDRRFQFMVLDNLARLVWWGGQEKKEVFTEVRNMPTVVDFGSSWLDGLEGNITEEGLKEMQARVNYLKECSLAKINDD